MFNHSYNWIFVFIFFHWKLIRALKLCDIIEELLWIIGYVLQQILVDKFDPGTQLDPNSPASSVPLPSPIPEILWPRLIQIHTYWGSSPKLTKQPGDSTALRQQNMWSRGGCQNRIQCKWIFPQMPFGHHFHQYHIPLGSANVVSSIGLPPLLPRLKALQIAVLQIKLEA